MPDKLKEAILRGQRTQEWWEKGPVQRVFKELDEDLKILWVKSVSDQDEERERLYRQVHGLKMLEARILQIIRDGQKAQAEVEAQERTENGNRDRSRKP